MKRRNLFLSLICSLILTVALVTVTVINLVPKKNNGTTGSQPSTNVSDPVTDEKPDVTVNEDRDGSAEKPYVIYSAETFQTFVVDKYLDEKGEYIDYTKVDEQGKLLHPELNAGLHYELDADIDFADVEFSTIFNKGVAFNGHINGNGHIVKNISIEVLKDNLVNDFTAVVDGELVANIGVFGDLNGAEIKNITFENISVDLEDGLYDYVWSANFETKNGTMNAIAVGSLAGVVNNSTIEANVTATIDAFAYSVYVENRADGLFAVGGVAASVENSTIANAKVDVDMIVNQGTNYFVGGVVGSAFDSKIEKVEVKAEILTHYEDALYIGGSVGYAIGLNMSEVNVDLTVSEIEAQRYNAYGISSIDNTKFVSVAGAVHTININNTASTVKEVSVDANVDVDGIYAGAVMDVVNGTDGLLVELSNIVVESNVNVLKVYGFARKLNNTKVDLSKTIPVYDEETKEEYAYNIKLNGKVNLESYNGDEEDMYTASIYVLENNNCQFVGGRKAVKVVTTADILNNTRLIEKNAKIWGLLKF